MKKSLIFLLVLILILTLTACNSVKVKDSADASAKESPLVTNIQDDSEVPLVINVSLGIQDTTDDGYETHETKIMIKEPYPDVDNWCDLIKERYGIDIEINYISTMYTQNVITGKYYIDNISSGDVTGLVLLENGYHNALAAMRNAAVIMPMNEYLENNEIFNALPVEMKYAYEYSDGDIWALPAEYNPVVYVRYYKKEWLDNLDMDVPGNPAELYSFIKAVVYNDPDKDGNKNEKGSNGMFYAGAGMFGDVFLANDCYMSNAFNTPIAYDHSTGAYEDAALKPEMTTVLNYVKNLIDENLVEFSPNYNFIKSENTGTFYGRDILTDDRETWTVGYSLSNGRQHSVAVEKPKKYYVLTGNTEDPQKTIDDLLNIFYSDTQGMLLGRYGIEGISYTVDNGVLDTSNRPSVNLLGEMLYLYDEEFKREESVRYAVIKDMIEKSMLVSDIILFDRNEKLRMQMLFTNIMIDNFLGVYGSVSVEDFLSEYIRSMEKAGGQQMLDKLNKEAGTTAEFSY